MSEYTLAVSDNDFEEKVLKSDVPVLVDFWAPWCGPCLAIGPVLEEIAKEYDGKVKIAKMNVDENANVPPQFDVRSIPFMVLIKDGKKVDSVVGAHPKAALTGMIDKVLS